MYRQGDVLIVPITAELPEGAQAVERDNGRIVLAYGEATGHSHAIASKSATLYAHGDVRYLHAKRPVALRHEEHARIDIPAGLYRIIRQVEYMPTELRTVTD